MKYQATQFILGQRKGILKTAKNGLKKWPCYIFRYNIERLSSKNNPNCDALLCIPEQDKEDLADLETELSNVYFLEEGIKLFDNKMLAGKSTKD